MINLQNKHILVVEDDDMSFVYMNQILALTHCEISRVKTGIDAIEFCKSNHKPDLVLLDIQLPDMDGENAAVEIRNFNKNIPIIVQTASEICHQKDQLIELGCNDLITKPFTVDELLGVIGRHI